MKKIIKDILKMSKEFTKPWKNNEWIEFAREYGAEYDEIKKKPFLSYQYFDTKIVCHRVPYRRDCYQYSVDFSASVTNSDDFRFTLEQRGELSFLIWSRKGFKIVKTGNDEIDSDFILRSNKPEIAKFIITSKPVLAGLEKIASRTYNEWSGSARRRLCPRPPPWRWKPKCLFAVEIGYNR